MVEHRASRTGRYVLSANIASLAFLAASTTAQAVPITYQTTFTALNAGAPLSGVVGLNPSATAQLTYDHATDLLSVHIQGTGFEPGVPHVAHIHGNLVNPNVSGSGALDSHTPTLAQDVDGDGFIELFEGLTTYGPILLDFMNIDPGMTGTINFNHTYDLRSSSTPYGFINPLDPSQGTYGITDVVGLDFNSLDLRELVIHGLTIPMGVGIDNPNQNPPLDDEVNGHSTFFPPPGQPEFGHTIVFPVASGELARVPEPSTWLIMIAGLAGFGWVTRKRSRQPAN